MTKNAKLSLTFFILAICVYIIAAGTAFAGWGRELRTVLFLAGTVFLCLGNVFSSRAKKEDKDR